MKKIIKRHIILLAIICLFMIFGTITGYGCLFFLVFKLPCPACGVSRAMLSLLRLDLYGYYRYNPMAVPLIISMLFMLNSDIVKHKRFALVFSFCSVIINFVIYFHRTVLTII